MNPQKYPKKHIKNIARCFFCTRRSYFCQKRHLFPKKIAIFAYRKLTVPKNTREHGKLHSIRTKISPRHVRVGRCTEIVDYHPEECHTHRQAGPRLSFLRPARSGKDHLCPHLRKDHQLRTSHPRGRALQQVRVVPVVQPAAFVLYLRARRGEQ